MMPLPQLRYACINARNYAVPACCALPLLSHLNQSTALTCSPSPHIASSDVRVLGNTRLRISLSYA